MLGTTIGQLEIVEEIGRGGMGIVYRAVHRLLGTQHAIKVLLPEWTQNPVIVQRFVGEARAAAAIRHRHVVHIEGLDQLPDGRWYIVMEYLEGATLAAFARAHGGPLSIHQSIEILCQIGAALVATHACGIVHRDLKLENVFLAQSGRARQVKVLDYGIAKLGDREHGRNTRTGQMMGTPGFMAPEQMRETKSVDARCDVYALGVIAYYLVTGGWLPHQHDGAPHSFYQQSAAAIFERQITQPPIDPRHRFHALPDRWVNAIRAALDNDPARRPQTARAFILLLAEGTPGDNFDKSGVEIVQEHAPELLEIGNLLETVRAPKPSAGSRATASRYRFDNRLGEGGMAEVFRGEMLGAEGFRRTVAIKRILPGYSNLAQFAEMFIAEARIVSTLQHANIVSVLDFDRDVENRLFLVMEYVDGKDLDRLRESGPLPWSTIIYVVVEMLRGLGYAHELPVAKQGIRGIVHRDVSPHNVLLSFDGDVKVSDFGIAKAREATAATASLVLKGKPGYMSPEQANGTALDGRSDLFAVGVILWELLTLQRLFDGDTREAIAQVFFRPIPRPSTLRPGVPADLEAITMTLLEREVGDRYANAELVIDALSQCKDAPRHGRRDLARLLAERFPEDVAARGGFPGDVSQGGVSSVGNGVQLASVVTAPARPDLVPLGVSHPPSTPTTLGEAASQSVVGANRSRTKLAIGAVVIAAFAATVIGLVVTHVKATPDDATSPATNPTTTQSVATLDVQPDAAASRSTNSTATAARTARVTIVSTPPGAAIEIAGESKGVAPISLTLPVGTKLAIRGTYSGFEDQALAATVDRENQVIGVVLVAKRAAVAGPTEAKQAPKRTASEAPIRRTPPPAPPRARPKTTTDIARPSTATTETKPTTAPEKTETKASGSNLPKRHLDPNAIGGDD